MSELPLSAGGVYPDVQLRFIDAEAPDHTRLLAGSRAHPRAEGEPGELAPRAEA